jgi:diguanylate cyclase (GGDEF)-like protein/PAS domain S-box-containing protein
VAAQPFLLQLLLGPNSEDEDLRNWRERILSSVLMVISVLGILTAIPSIWLAISEDRWSIAWVDVAALIWIGTIWRARTLPYRLRASNLVLLIYLLGLWFLFMVGPTSQIYLMAFPVMTALLLGLRPALLALALNAVTLLVLGYLFNTDMHVPGFEHTPLMRWVVITINFMFVNAVITVSCAVLLHQLERSLERQRAIAKSLQEGRDRLEQINQELHLTGTALTRLNDMVGITEAEPTDPPGPRIVFVNEAFEQRTGYSRAEIVGRTPRVLQGPGTSREELDRIKDALRRQEPVRAELLNYGKDGQSYWLELNIVPVTNEQGLLTHWVSVERDITERKKAEADIHRLAYFDALTGLPNRRMLLDRLGQVLATDRRTGQVGALLYLDLDRFKNINDARGHAAGDELLQRVGQRLLALMREEDTVARLGGDEFVILSPHLVQAPDDGSRAALTAANRVREALEEPFLINGQPFSTSGSIGVTMLPRDALSPDDLLREADTAMYRAKAAGRNRVAFFRATMQAQLEARLALEHDLSQAIAAGQLALHLQPQVAPDGRTIGAEMLLRWQHPVRGNVPPAEFIPVAEETSLILRLGDWVLEHALRSQVRLQAAGWRVPLSVNVSPRQFRQTDFVVGITRLLAQTGADPTLLVLEITESVLLDGLEGAVHRMEQLAALGIRFSIDDFGTGYSSLAYLKRLPLYELKIDRSFIQDTPGDPSDTAIVKLILSMAQHLGLRVVAEGVETREQADFLAAHGCDALQGYYYARPQPLDEWLAGQAEPA